MQHSCSHYNAFRSIPWQTRTYLRTWQHQITTMKQPFQCNLQPEIQEPHRTTHTDTTTRCKTHRRNNSRTKRPQPHPSHRRGTFHRRLQPLYTEKHTVSCSGFLPNSPHIPSSPLPFIITYVPSSPLPFFTTRFRAPASSPTHHTSLRHHSPSSSLTFLRHHFPSSLRHHFPSSPLPFLTTSLRHHSPSSSLPFFTTSLRYHSPSSSLPFFTHPVS